MRQEALDDAEYLACAAERIAALAALAALVAPAAAALAAAERAERAGCAALRVAAGRVAAGRGMAGRMTAAALLLPGQHRRRHQRQHASQDDGAQRKVRLLHVSRPSVKMDCGQPFLVTAERDLPC